MLEKNNLFESNGVKKNYIYTAEKNSVDTQVIIKVVKSLSIISIYKINYFNKDFELWISSYKFNVYILCEKTTVYS